MSCRFGEELRCYSDGLVAAKVECDKLGQQNRTTLKDSYEKGYEDGFQEALLHFKGHTYTWLEWIRDVLIDLIAIITALLLIGFTVGHFKTQHEPETFATTSNRGKLAMRRSIIGLQHIGVLKGAEACHNEQQAEHHRPLLDALTS